jgi:hypothetical protein
MAQDEGPEFKPQCCPPPKKAWHSLNGNTRVGEKVKRTTKYLKK